MQRSFTWKKGSERIVRTFSRRVTPAGYLSRVSLHSTFTDTMSLRSLLRRPTPFSASSRAIWGTSSKILVMGFHSGDCGCSTSSFASLAIDLSSCWTVRSQSEQYPGIHYRRCVDTTEINEISRGPHDTTSRLTIFAAPKSVMILSESQCPFRAS